MSHQTFLRQAVQLAVDNVKNGGGPFAAIVVKDGKVIAEGVNRVTAQHDPTAHAEIQAIRAACQQLRHFQLDDCVLYTSCEPCPMCFGAIYWARLSRVYYVYNKWDAAAAGFDDQFIYDQLELVEDKQRIPMQQLTIEHVTSPFAVWQEIDDKIEY
jgi:guanine deaminase